MGLPGLKSRAQQSGGPRGGEISFLLILLLEAPGPLPHLQSRQRTPSTAPRTPARPGHWVPAPGPPENPGARRHLKSFHEITSGRVR